MKNNQLASKANPGGALPRPASSLATIFSTRAGERIRGFLICATRITTGLAVTVQMAIAASASLSWNANPETDLAGYRVSYGSVSGVYTDSISVGTTPAASITGLSEGVTYYFAVAAINQTGLQSPLSSPVSYLVPKTVVANQPPVALGGAFSTNEDTPAAITLTGSDPENSPIGFILVNLPAKGTLSGNPPYLTYTPSVDFNGSDSFSFRTNDGSANSADATISITVKPVNDTPVAAAKTLTTTEDVPLTIVLTGSDADLNSLTFSLVSGPANGTLSGTPPNLTYSPALNYSGSDQFSFRVNDGTAFSAAATITVSTTATNDAPIAQARSVSTLEDTPVSITLAGSDVENSPLTFVIVSGPAKGTLSGSAPNLSYTPSPDFFGNDSFTYRVSDGSLNSTVAAVSVGVTAVNDTPLATSLILTTAEDTALPMTLSGSDKDSDKLTFSVVTGPTAGTLTGTIPDLTYTPGKNFNGSDQFTFRVNDGTVSSALATVFVRTTPANDAPVAVGKLLATDEDTQLPVTLEGSDVEAGSLTYAILVGPAKGTLSGSPPNLIYAPLKNFNGTDSFSFLVNDGSADSLPATVTISVAPVNDPPIATNQSVETPQDTPVTITLAGGDPEGTPVTWVVANPPVNGTLSGSAPNLIYQPNTGFSGSDQFVIKSSDGLLSSSPATVSIQVNPASKVAVNISPVFSTGSVVFQATENEPMSVQLNASDENPGDILTFSKLSGPAWLSVTTSGQLGGTPLDSDVGDNSFGIRVTDQAGAIAETQITVRVANVNDAPAFVINPVTVGDASENVSYKGETLADKVTDPDAGDLLAFAKVSGPAWLSVAPTGELSGTPPKGSTGLNTFIVRVSDASASTDAELKINVTGLPLPWTSMDIGSGQLAGTSIQDSGIFEIVGSGALGGTTDKLRFTYQTLTGDGELIAKIRSRQKTSGGAPVGIMIRETLATNSRQVFMGVTGTDSYRLLRRPFVGFKNSSLNGGTALIPNTWVRLARRGSEVTAFKSNDGISWTSVGTTSIPMGTSCYIGLSVSSGKNNSTNTTEFSNVRVER